MITDEQLDNMLHALGKSHTSKRSEMGWRNHFNAAECDKPSWDDLVSKGLADRHGNNYRVSDFGLKILGVTLK